MRQIQYKQHQYHYCGNINIQVLECVKHERQIKEEEYNKQTLYYQKIYEEKMKNIYEELKLMSV